MAPPTGVLPPLSPAGQAALSRQTHDATHTATQTVEAQAYAYRQIVAHLQAVSDDASNIDVMGAAGMCRNCVAKWSAAARMWFARRAPRR